MMKKSIVMLFGAAVSVCVMAKPVWNIEKAKFQMSSEELSAISNVTSNSKSVIAVKNELLRTGNKIILSSFVNYHSLNQNEIDATFGPLGCFASSRELPMCSTNLLNYTVDKDEFMELYEFLAKNGIPTFSSYLYGNIKLSPDEFIYFLKIAFENFSLHLDAFRYWQERFKNSYVTEVKHLLRRQGKSFVVGKDGKNPMSQYMDAFVAALNAPRFSGLDECMKAIGINDFNVDLSFLPNENEINELKNDILNGDKSFEGKNATILLICLGVDGYNQFVREYNGEE